MLLIVGLVIGAVIGISLRNCHPGVRLAADLIASLILIGIVVFLFVNPLLDALALGLLVLDGYNFDRRMKLWRKRA